MKVKLIDYPAGYQIRVTTWENDGDDYETSIISGLTYPDVVFYKELANCFTSQHNPRSGGGMGNMDQSQGTLIDLLEETLLDHPNIGDSLKKSVEAAKKDAYGFFYEFLGNPVQYDYEFCRVVESVKIFYLDEPLLVEYDELTDVTKDFK